MPTRQHDGARFLRDNGTATNGDEDGSGNDSDGTTPAPIPASTMPNTALL